jgi:predicted ATPase
MLMNFRIKSGEYGLLRSGFEWDAIPPLAIVTGPNGVGKTQLLRALGVGLRAGSDDWRLRNLKVEIALEDGGVPPTGILLPSEWPPISEGSRENFRALIKSIEEFHDIGRKTVPHEHYEPYWREIEARTGKPRDAITQAEVARNAPAHLFSKAQRNNLYSLGRLFFTYHVFAEFSRSHGESEAAIAARLGPAPWDILNQILNTAAMPFRVNCPTGALPGHFEDLTYELELHDSRSGRAIDLGLLSSGERIILSMALWRYVHDLHGDQPHTLLLDEPDAHLHPSLIQQFLDVLQEDFISKWGYRVILTTHSPTTAALSPEGSLFEMTRDPVRVVHGATRWEVVDRLSEGLVTVGPDTKTVFVEDVDDQRFYSRLFEELVRLENTHRPVLDTRPNLVFLPVHAAAPGETGGRTKIESLLREIGSGTSIYGIADNDGNLKTVAGVHLTHRRMLENYLYDPLVIFGLLASREQQPMISGIPSRLDEREIRNLPNIQQQAIIDHMLLILSSKLEPEVVQETEGVPVEFINGASLVYPRWFLQAHGKRHLLIPAFTQKFHGGIKREDLGPMYWRVKMIPSDLAEMMKKIQKPTLSH